MENWFLPIFYPIFLELCLLIQLWKITPLFYNNFSVSGGSFPPSPCGQPCIVAGFFNLKQYINEVPMRYQPNQYISYSSGSQAFLCDHDQVGRGVPISELFSLRVFNFTITCWGQAWLFLVLVKMILDLAWFFYFKDNYLRF